MDTPRLEFEERMARGAPDNWLSLSDDDHDELYRLHDKLACQARQRSLPLARDLELILAFIEKCLSLERGRDRTMVCGCCFGGPFLIINTRQLHVLLGRSKSSVNAGLYALGYVALRNREKSRLLMTAALPSLDAVQSRSWTVRFGLTSSFSFVGSFRPVGLPEITPDDCMQERFGDIDPEDGLPVRARARESVQRSLSARAPRRDSRVQSAKADAPEEHMAPAPLPRAVAPAPAPPVRPPPLPALLAPPPPVAPAEVKPALDDLLNDDSLVVGAFGFDRDEQADCEWGAWGYDSFPRSQSCRLPAWR